MFGATTSYSFSMVPQLVDTHLDHAPASSLKSDLHHLARIERTNTFTRKEFLSRR
jgi:hypothetical protein